MKKFLSPLQNMVRADLFSGSLVVWNARGFAARFARPPNPSRAKRGEEIWFELFSIYTASRDLANFLSPRASLRLGARLLICIHFWLKKKIVD